MASDKPTPMTIREAIDSLLASLEQGDKLMSSKTWSGGNFKSEAIRLLIERHGNAGPGHVEIGAVDGEVILYIPALDHHIAFSPDEAKTFANTVLDRSAKAQGVVENDK